MERIGVPSDGCLTMPQFLKLLCQPQWSFVLPEDLRQRVPFLLLKNNAPLAGTHGTPAETNGAPHAAGTSGQVTSDIKDVCLLISASPVVTVAAALAVALLAALSMPLLSLLPCCPVAVAAALAAKTVFTKSCTCRRPQSCLRLQQPHCTRRFVSFFALYSCCF